MPDPVPPPKKSKDRSPSFPFIPLQTAVERLEAYEKTFGRHATPAGKVGLAWGLKLKSSQADQTLAALRSYGFVTYDGLGDARMVSLTEEARTYIRANQESVKQAVLKQAALRPKTIRKFWATWGTDRPMDDIALDDLILKNGFTIAGAETFLKVYDATILFAGLSKSDKVSGDAGDLESDEESDVSGPAESEKLEGLKNPAFKDKPKVEPKVDLMSGERELATGLLSNSSSFRLIVSGKIGEKEIERLIKKLELDKEILAEPDASDEV